MTNIGTSDILQLQVNIIEDFINPII